MFSFSVLRSRTFQSCVGFLIAFPLHAAPITFDFSGTIQSWGDGKAGTRTMISNQEKNGTVFSGSMTFDLDNPQIVSTAGNSSSLQTDSGCRTRVDGACIDFRGSAMALLRSFTVTTVDGTVSGTIDQFAPDHVQSRFQSDITSGRETYSFSSVAIGTDHITRIEDGGRSQIAHRLFGISLVAQGAGVSDFATLPSLSQVRAAGFNFVDYTLIGRETYDAARLFSSPVSLYGDISSWSVRADTSQDLPLPATPLLLLAGLAGFMLTHRHRPTK